MRRERGQLAVGLALSFTAICAIFGLIMNSAMITREKMKLQQTTDFATIVAANVQRENLHHIQKRNEEIEALYLAAYQVVALNWADIDIILPTPQIPREVFIAAVETKTQGQVVPTSCAQGGIDYDHWVRENIYVPQYKALRDLLANDITNVVYKANETAHEHVLRAFLIDQNLPHGLRRILAQTIGKNPTRGAIRSAWDSGLLSDYLEISDTSEMPLFFPASEGRQFNPPKYAYRDELCGNCQTASCWPCCLPSGMNSLGGLPDSLDSEAKVYRLEGYRSNYLVRATYSPPNTFIDRTFSHHLKKPKARSGPNSQIKSFDNRPLRLFDINETDDSDSKKALEAWAQAKPYGGEFPTAGFPYWPLGIPIDAGSVGSNFDGAKLVGIADYKREQEGFQLWGENGFPLPTGEFVLMEDFLH